MKRQTILVPLDGSDEALAALPYAAAFARISGSGIELLAVIDVPLDPQSELVRGLVAQGLAHTLDRIAARLHAEGLWVETCIREGDAAEWILMHAEKRRARAVVMTTHTRGGLDRLLIGSVADTVVRGAACSVLTVRAAAAASPFAEWRPRRLLVPLDGSPIAEAALTPAYELAAAFRAEVVLARVQPWLTSGLTGYATIVPEVATLDSDAATGAATYLHALRDAAPPGVAVRDVILRGDPIVRLTALAEADAIDLVVMTSHGRGGLTRMLLGSVATSLIGRGLPTFVFRQPVEEHLQGLPPDSAIELAG